MKYLFFTLAGIGLLALSRKKNVAPLVPEPEPRDLAELEPQVVFLPGTFTLPGQSPVTTTTHNTYTISNN